MSNRDTLYRNISVNSTDRRIEYIDSTMATQKGECVKRQIE